MTESIKNDAAIRVIEYKDGSMALSIRFGEKGSPEPLISHRIAGVLYEGDITLSAVSVQGKQYASPTIH